MQEVNSVCTDSGPLRAEYCIVEFHTIQPSSYIVKCLDDESIQVLACARKFLLYVYVYDKTAGKMRNCVIHKS